MPARSRGSKLHGRQNVHVEVEPRTVFAGRILYRGRIIPAELGVSEEGRILKVAPSVRGGRRVDLGEALLLPSAIDLHVHFRDPSPPGSVEDFQSGTVQAALGGVGAVVDMPNTDPPTTSVERLEEKGDRFRAKAEVDGLLLAALRTETRVEELAAQGAGFKLYMAPTTGDLAAPPGTDLRPLLERVARTGAPVHVHAEDPRLFQEGLYAVDPEGWAAKRPARSEISAVRSLLPLAEGLRLHLAHATTVEAVELARGAGWSVEATPQHLLLAATAHQDARWKVNPPLRSVAERDALFGSFKTGRVTMLASDHAPHALSEKERPFPEAPSGMPGVETMLPLLLEKVRSGDLALPTLVAAAARRPALFLGLPRGHLAAGMEANFLVVDFRDKTRIRARDLHAPCGWTAFEGREGIFPRAHYLRGRQIVEDGEFVGDHTGLLLSRGDGAGASLPAAPTPRTAPRPSSSPNPSSAPSVPSPSA
ncbi:MAG: amidohydrolase family protein [Euryarchaeota archaeon]|nr:amidohydrolase family protein [Euryarchaeota archaeon]MDE1836055.1 amidohydrolase family protein [Euryarchaeota archaeon]MDE1879997.1 amidohydrolase family protein [Euryarchaeota archaeon]MDE2044033.1 amidohydrolase family protein [Thermoplasmata archaeon]